MYMKKLLAALFAAALFFAALPATADARHHGGNVSGGYALCSADGCGITGSHWHGGTRWAGHYIDDGHDYHELCGVINCTRAGAHIYNSAACLTNSTGKGCH
jgi:hypothetical protein